MPNLLTAIGRAQPVTQYIDSALKVQGGMNQADLAAQQKQLNEMKLREEERKNEWLDVTEIKGRMEKGGYGGAADLAIEHAISTGKHQEVQDPLGNKRVMVRRRDIDTGLDAVGKNAQAQPVLLARREQWLSEQIDKVKMGDPKSEEQAKTWAEERRMIRNKLYGADAEKGFTLSEGQKRYDAAGKEVAAVPPKPEEQWSDPAPMVIDGKTVMTQKSSKTGQIRTVAQGSTTNVNVDVDMGLSKGARAKAEEDVQESTDMYKGLETLVSISKPEFFTYKGQIQAGAERLGEKAGVVKNPAFLKEYTSWKVGTEQMFNRYRKWATGVAAGEKELQRIEGSFPNINMSNTEYMSALRLTAVNAWKLAERRRRALNAGINDPGKQKEFYRLLPLDSMPDPPPEVIQRFSPKSKFEIIGVE